MAEQVHLAVVAVAEPAVGDRGRNACGKIAERLDPDVAAAAQNRAGQPGTAELRPGDDAHLDSRRRRPLEGGGHRLYLFGRHGVTKIVAPRVRAPAQRVHHSDAGQPKRHTHQTVLAGPAAGADGGQPGHGGRREACLQRPTT